MSLKDNLKKYRKSAHLTLFDASGAIGISIATLQRYESGSVTHIPHHNLLKLADLYQTTVAELYGQEENIPFMIPTLDSKRQPNERKKDRLQHYSDVLGAEDAKWILKKYQALDNQGKHLISALLDAEYQRCEALADNE